MTTQNYNILSCDGGGIRGLLPAILIEKIAAADTNFLGNTSLFAGTSTGGIIALSLAAQKSTSDIVGLYSNSCGSIFADSPAATLQEMEGYIKNLVPAKYQGTIADAVVAAVATSDDAGLLPKNLFSAKYANTSLQQLLTQQLGSGTVGSVKPVFVTTYMLDSAAGQWTPASIDNLQGSTTSGCSLVEAALSTGAAPTFFPPYFNSTLGQYCVDGGTFANNPSTFVLARLLAQGVPLSSIRMLSISTGRTTNAVPSSYFSSTTAADLWGTFQYFFPQTPASVMPNELLINLMMDGSSSVDDLQTSAMLGSQYMRIDVPLGQPVTLDDCAVVPTLTNIAEQYWDASQDAILQWVSANFV